MHRSRSHLDYKEKRRRPFSSKKSLHVVLRSNHTNLRNLKNKRIISLLLFKYSQKYKIRVYQNSLNSNHIHLVVYAKEKSALQNFLRVFAGQTAQKITSATKGKALKKPFWMQTVWSRVIEWGKAFSHAIEYVLLNQREVLGLEPYRTGRGLKAPPAGRIKISR